MKFTDEEIEEFKRIYKAEHGEDISTQRAIELATRLINLLKVVYDL